MSVDTGFEEVLSLLSGGGTLFPDAAFGVGAARTIGFGAGLAGDFAGGFADVLAGAVEAGFLIEALGMAILLLALQTDGSISGAVRANAQTLPVYPIHCLLAGNRKAAIFSTKVRNVARSVIVRATSFDLALMCGLTCADWGGGLTCRCSRFFGSFVPFDRLRLTHQGRS